jgi:hypothetical protein
MGIKPGWVRLSFNYFIDDEVAGFLVEAVDLLATSGHRLLGDYRFDPRSGHWRHRDAPPDPVLSLPDLLDSRSGPGPAGGGDLAGHLERLRDFHLPTTAWSRPSADGQ